MKNELLSSVKLPEVNSRRGIQTVQAGPVAAVVMALTGTATLGAALGKIVLGLAVNALMRKKRKARGGSTPGIKTDVSTVGGTTPQSFILGRYATGGNHVAPAMSMEQSGSTKNANLVFVMDVADMPVKSITRIMVDGEYVTFNTTPDANGFLAAQGRLNGYMWAKFHDGTQTAADPWLISKLGSYPDRPWGADMIGRGIAYAVLMFKYNRERYSGLPSVKFEVDGISLYDPRKDNTVAGGSGPQRWDDPTTWRFTTNPAVMIYNILRGIPLPGGKVYGLGVSADEIPLSHAVAAMNVCDTVPPGRSVAQFRAGYEVKIGSEDDGGEDPLTVIDELLKAMDGDVAEVGGNWYMRAGGPGLPVMTITDGDIVRNKPQDLDPFPGLGETVNGLHASGPDPDALWEAKEAPARYLADAIAEDGQPLTTSINLPSVFDRIQMQQLMKAWLEDARRFAKHNISLMPHAANLVPLDVIRWNSERNKYTNKDFEIDQMGISARTLAPTLAIREVDPAAGRWQPGDDLPETTPPPVVVVPAPEAVPGAAVDGIAIEDDNGKNRRAAVRIRWTPDLPDAQAIMYKVVDKKTGQLVTNGSTNNIEDGEEIISAGILPVTAYRVQIRMRANRETIWTNAFEVTTPQVYLQSGEVDPDLIDAIEQAQNTADAAGQAANQALNDAQSANANAAQAATDAAAAHTEAQQAAADAAANAGRIGTVEQNVTLLRSDVDLVEADLQNNYLTAAQTNQAIAAAEQTLQAEIGNVETNLQNNYYTKAQTNSAITTSENSMTAKIDTAEAMQLVSGFAENGKFWQSAADREPFGDNQASLDSRWKFATGSAWPNVRYTYVSAADMGSGAVINLYNRGAITPVVGRTYRIRAWLWRSGSITTTGPVFSMFFRALDDDYAYLGRAAGFTSHGDPGSGWTEFEAEVTCSTSNVAAYWRPGLYLRPNDFTLAAGGWIGVVKMTVEDITDAVDLGGEIQEIATLDINALQGTALANLLTQLNVDASGSSAAIEELRQTQASTDGFAQAFAGLTVQTNGGNIAGFKATSWDDPDGSSGATLELLGDVLVQGSLSANRLTVGIGKNMLENPDFLQQNSGWTLIKNGTIGNGATIERRTDNGSFGTDFYPTLRVITPATNTSDGNADIAARPTRDDGTTGIGYPVNGGSWYELSARVFHRYSEIQVILFWYGATGTYISGDVVYTGDRDAGGAGGGNPAAWSKVGGVAQAPSGAVYVIPRFRIRRAYDGTNKDLYIFQPMLCESAQDAALSPYSPGTTASFDGGRLIADTVTADKMNVNELSAITAKIGTFKSADSGERVEIEDDRIRVFDSSNTARVIIGRLS